MEDEALRCGPQFVHAKQNGKDIFKYNLRIVETMLEEIRLMYRGLLLIKYILLLFSAVSRRKKFIK